MSFATRTLECLDDKEAVSLVQGLKLLKDTHGEQLTVQIVNSMFKIGGSNVECLLKNTDLAALLATGPHRVF